MAIVTEFLFMYVLLCGFAVFLAIDAIFFHIKKYEVQKPRLFEFLNSLLFIRIFVRSSSRVETISNWFYSKPFGYGNGRNGWLIFIFLGNSIYIFFRIRTAVIEGNSDLFLLQIVFTIIMLATLYVAYTFGSKLKDS